MRDDKFYDPEYRKPGVEWSPNEMPMLKAIPKAYVYDCQKCGKEFTQNYEIHIPWCDDCRRQNLDNLIKDARPDTIQKEISDFDEAEDT